MRAASLLSPMPMTALVGPSVSRIPGPPFGPSTRMTMTSPLWICLERMARVDFLLFSGVCAIRVFADGFRDGDNVDVL